MHRSVRGVHNDGQKFRYTNLFDPTLILTYIRVASMKANYEMIPPLPFPWEAFSFKPQIKEDRYP